MHRGKSSVDALCAASSLGLGCPCQRRSARCDADLFPAVCCASFQGFYVQCEAVQSFPNATVAEYGTVSGEGNIMAEVFARGPVACEIDAIPLRDYKVETTQDVMSLFLTFFSLGTYVSLLSCCTFFRASMYTFLCSQIALFHCCRIMLP